MPKPYRSELLEAGPRKRGRPRGRWMPKHPKVVIYTRFSPRPDAEECKSCELQVSDCRTYCERRTWFPAEDRTFLDKDQSGADRDRPGLFAAIDATRRGMVFLVDRWDRLGRDTLWNLNVAEDVKRRGAILYSVQEGPWDDEASPETKLLSVVLSAVAEYLRKKANAKTSAKMRAHVRSGRVMSAETPLGWEHDPDGERHAESGRPIRMRRNEEEQRQIARVLYILSEMGWSHRKVARYMNEQDRPIRGRAWSHKTIRKILDFQG